MQTITVAGMTKIMAGKSNAGRKLLLLFALLYSASQPITHASKDNTMINLNRSIWNLIDDIQTQSSLTLAHVEKTLVQTLAHDTRHSNEYFKFYKGQSIQFAGEVKVSTIDLRLPQQGAQSPGMLLMYLEGKCITMPQLKQQYENLKITEIPRGKSLEEATTYTANNSWGEIDFGFQMKKPDCLAYVILKPVK
jgi:hypothetical protein